jgi:serine/threonine-protein kinase
LPSRDPAPIVLVDGRVFHGRYEVVRCLQTGGMGAVYEVVDRNTRRRRALKVMLPGLADDADLRARFKLEATITAEIESPHLVETLDADVDAETGAPFVVMELLKGEDLGAVLARRGKLPADEALGLLHQAALGLEKTHAAGVIHRDLKPANLFVTPGDDGSVRLRVLDFGIAKLARPATSDDPMLTTRALGTPLFMPPEQIRGDGDIGPRADGYALAHVAYALLTGEPYWNEESAASPALYAIFSRMLAGVVEPPTARALRRSGVTLPDAFDAWFAQATARDAADRFGGASALVAALAAALGLADAPPERGPLAVASAAPSRGSAAVAATIEAAPTTMSVVSTHAAPRAQSRSPVPWLVAATVAAALAVIAALSLRPGGPAGPAHAELAPPPPVPVTALAVVAEPPVIPVDRVASPPAAAPPSAPSASHASPRRPSRAGAAASPAPIPPARGAATGAYDPTDVR